MHKHVNIFKIYTVCVCVYIYSIHKNKQHTHVNKNFYFWMQLIYIYTFFSFFTQKISHSIFFMKLHHVSKKLGAKFWRIVSNRIFCILYFSLFIMKSLRGFFQHYLCWSLNHKKMYYFKAIKKYIMDSRSNEPYVENSLHMSLTQRIGCCFLSILLENQPFSM